MSNAGLRSLAAMAILLACGTWANAETFYALKDVHAGLRGVGRTIFEGNRIEEFQVEVLGVLENIGPRQSIILARLSGGPLAQTGILQGMSGSPVYIDGKLLGAVALGFPFSKEPIAGIQPIEQMIRDARFSEGGGGTGTGAVDVAHVKTWQMPDASKADGTAVETKTLTDILTPLALSGFTPGTLQAFASQFHRLGFEPQQGVSGGTPKSQEYSGSVSPGSMISVQLVSGDMSISADGTVTYVDGRHVYAFGHRFLDGGTTDLPFARAEVLALMPNLSSSFKISRPMEWVGTMVSDRSTAIAGEIGQRARVVPVTIDVKQPKAADRLYHLQVVNDRFLTPFLTQSAVFSVLDSTERTLGAGTIRMHGTVNFEGSLPPLVIRDVFVSDSGVALQAAANSVVPLGFVMAAGFSDVRVKNITFEMEPYETKRQVQIEQVWTSRRELKPGESFQITALLTGENGLELTRTASYRVPVGAQAGVLNITVSDANTLNFPDFAGLNPVSLHSGEQLVRVINGFRGSEGAYVRIWRPQPSFLISGPLPGGELSDPPPSVALILGKASASIGGGALIAATRGAQVSEMPLPVSGYVISGAKTVQVEVKD